MVLQAAASFFVCVLAILALRPLAIAVDLIDRPGGRKTHHGNVPIVGGLAMFIGVVLGMGLVPLPAPTGGAYLAACAILVTIGLVDDRFNLSPWTRLPGQIAATLLLIFGGGVAVTSLGDPFGTGPISFSGDLSLAFTVLIVTAAINAFNMLDGLDGLAGSVALTSLLAIAFLSWRSGLPVASAVSVVLIGAISAFLVFNVPIRLNRALRCFMGDAGSTLLGFSIAWLCIQISEGPHPALSPVTTLWIVALPLYELVWSTARRVVRGVSPFKADADHFHHLLLKAGFSVRGTFLACVALTIIFAGVGLAFGHYHVSDRTSFFLLVGCGVATIRLMYRAKWMWLVIPKPLRRFRSLRPGPDFSRPTLVSVSGDQNLPAGSSSLGSVAANPLQVVNDVDDLEATVRRTREADAQHRQSPPGDNPLP